MKFIHIGDLHIGKRLGNQLLIEDQRYVFEQILEVAKSEQVDGILIAGDVFDRSTPSKDALDVADELLTNCIRAGFPVFMVPGNHDSAQQVSYCSGITSAFGLHIAKEYNGEITICRLEDEHGPVDIHLMPFIRPADVRFAFKDQADDIATFTDAIRVALEHDSFDPVARHILVAHQFVVNGGDKPETCESETHTVGGLDSVEASLFDAFDYVALGHIHGKQHVRRPEVRYCGTPLKYSFSEVNHVKTITVVELGGADGREVTIRELPIQPLHEMREITAHFDDLIAGCDAGNHEDYMRVILKDTFVADAMNRLRVIYPNILKLDWTDSIVAYSGDELSLEAASQKSVDELFCDFFEEQTGNPLDDEDRELIISLLAQQGGEAR